MNILVSIDTETGGLDPLAHDLLSVGWTIRTLDGALVERQVFYHRLSTYRVTDKAMEVNGLNLADVNADGLTTPELAARILTFVDRVKAAYFPGEKVVFAGHNVPFDIGFIRELLRAAGNGALEQWGMKVSHQVLDTKPVIFALQQRGYFAGLGSSSLGNVAGYLGVQVDGALHQADVDADVTAQVALAVLETVPTAEQLRLLELAASHLLQIDAVDALHEWYDEDGKLCELVQAIKATPWGARLAAKAEEVTA
jgi:DNA polymerase III epsilon subunit-like protein